MRKKFEYFYILFNLKNIKYIIIKIQIYFKIFSYIQYIFILILTKKE